MDANTQKIVVVAGAAALALVAGLNFSDSDSPEALLQQAQDHLRSAEFAGMQYSQYRPWQSGSGGDFQRGVNFDRAFDENVATARVYIDSAANSPHVNGAVREELKELSLELDQVYFNFSPQQDSTELFTGDQHRTEIGCEKLRESQRRIEKIKRSP